MLYPTLVLPSILILDMTTEMQTAKSTWFFLIATILGTLPLGHGWVQAEPPKLVVVVSVDQLCQDYLLRFRDNLDEKGFFRKVAERGASFSQCYHQHAFTLTAPGHAVQLTGAYPNMHGIITNTWYDRVTNKDRYCVADESVKVIGIDSSKSMSPKNLLVETVGDVLRQATRNQAKVFGVAIKDRAAILMSGHNANAAFWLEKNKWVTSSYYLPELPGYLRVLNNADAINRFRKQSWKLLLPPERYHNQGPDANAWENPPKGMTNAFPHELAVLGEVEDDVFGDQVLFSPFGNDFTLQAAQEIVIHESLGKDAIPDLLAINFSSNDYVGHAFGPHSLEVEDITYRTDLQLAGFADFLDQEVGQDHWTMILTADHGVAPVVEYANQYRLPAHRNPLGDKLATMQTALEQYLRSHIRVTVPDLMLIEKLEENQVFLDHEHPDLAGDQLEFAANLLKRFLLEVPHLHAVRTRSELQANPQDWLGQLLHRSLHPQRSGDVLIVYSPYVVPGEKGTTHGSPWHYDRHVPLMLLGNGIRTTACDRPVSPACIASTVARLLEIDYPSANVEQPLVESLKSSPAGGGAASLK